MKVLTDLRSQGRLLSRDLLLGWRRVNVAAVMVMLVAATSPLCAQPQSPEESLRTMRLADGNLEIELVAAEPQVKSPVAIAWDAEERMYVAEMIDYPSGPAAGQITRISDNDRDGRFETSTVFADQLRFPNSVLPWRDGVLVTTAPDLVYLRDADNDGRADERRVILTGFGQGNQQLRANGLFWGLDNWVYGANGRSDGELRRPGDSKDGLASIRRRDFRFRPDTGRFEAVAGPSQFGHSRDDWGNRFLSWNTIPVRQAILDPLPPAVSAAPEAAFAVVNILDPADNGRLFPSSRPPMTFNRESVEFFNAGCGLTIFRGTALGEEYYGNTFVCEPLTNIIHRRLLVPSGSTFVAKRADVDHEFLSSTDPWFHPVNLATGPDGAIYVVDFYRRWVEHPEYVPAQTRATIDWREGSAHGRIWRIRHKSRSFKAKDVAKAQSKPLGRVTTEDLVAALEERNGWRRDTAQRLIVERQDKRAIPPLKNALQSAATPETSVHALYCLDALDGIDDDVLLASIHHANPRVREHGVRLSARRMTASEAIRRALVQQSGDADPRVRLQVAATLANFDTSTRTTVAMRLVSVADDPWVMRTVVDSLGDGAGGMLQALLHDQPWGNAPSEAQLQLLVEAATAAARFADHAALAQIVQSEELLPTQPVAIERLAVMTGLAEGLARSGRPLRKLLDDPPPKLDDVVERWREWLNSAADLANQPTKSDDERLLAVQLLAIRLLTHGSLPAECETLANLATSAGPPTLQAAAAHALVERGEPASISQLFDAWPRFATSIRRDILAAVLRSPQAAESLVSALENGKVQPNELDRDSREALRRVRSAELKARVERLLKDTQPASRAAVLRSYQVAMSLSADATRGEKLFTQHCFTCHVFRGRGHRVGPDLSGVAARTKEILLADLLDPSGQVAADFTSYLLTTDEGQVFSGLLVAETDRAVTLRRGDGVEETVERKRIDELRSAGRSLMPDGFEQLLTPQDAADLIGYLRQPP